MLELEYKKIPSKTQIEMREAVGSENDYYTIATKEIQKVIPSKETYILNSANSCIFTITEALPDPILIPDMGGWNGIERSADILNKKVKKIETNNGLITPERLEEYLSIDNSIKSLYLTSLAGYTALQPIHKIYEICKKQNIILIIDISGSIGSDLFTNLNDYDIIISSTGSPKIVNVENGGFINLNTDMINLNNHLIKSFKADNITCAGIASEINNSSKIYETHININMYLKENMNNLLKNDKNYTIIHPKEQGINTIIKTPSKSKAKKLSFKIREKITINNNKSIITTGPNYNRIKKPCVCIETKNLNPNSLTKENMDEISEIIIESIKELETDG